jgi:hypothetical protein
VELPITHGRTITTSIEWVCLLQRISVSTTIRPPTTCTGLRLHGKEDNSSKHKISGSKITLGMASNGIRTTIISGIIKATINITHNKILQLILGGLTMAKTISGGHRIQLSTLVVITGPILQTTGCKTTIIINGDRILRLMEEEII